MGTLMEEVKMSKGWNLEIKDRKKKEKKREERKKERKRVSRRSSRELRGRERNLAMEGGD